MTKKELVKTISEKVGVTQQQVKKIVQRTFDVIVETLVEEGRIELRNFGVFEVKKRAARRARNPKTGERVSVGEKYVVTFKPGKHMEERVRTATARRLGARTADQPGEQVPEPPPSVAYGVLDAEEGTRVPHAASPTPPGPRPETGASAAQGYGRSSDCAGPDYR